MGKKTRKVDYSIILREIDKHNSILIKQLISQYYPLSIGLIDKYSIDKLDYQLILMNENIDWNKDTILYFFEMYNDLDYLYNNPAIYFTSQIIEKLVEKIDWNQLSYKKEVNWTSNLLEKYENNWNWSGISSNESIKWTKILVDKFFYKLDFNELSKNQNLSWLEAFVKQKIKSLTNNIYDFCFENSFHIESWEWTPEYNLFKSNFDTKKDWDFLSTDENIPWTILYISRRKKYWNWYFLSKNKSLPWSPELVKKFSKNWDWSSLSYNTYLPWSETIIELYKEKWDWYGISLNSGINWDMSLIEKYESLIEWSGLSMNPNLSWSSNLIEKYFNKWSWEDISNNNGFLWTKEVFEKYIDYIDWNHLCEVAEKNIYLIYINDLSNQEIELLLNSQKPFKENEFINYVENGDKIIERSSDMYGYSLEKYDDDLDWDQQGPEFDF